MPGWMSHGDIADVIVASPARSAVNAAPVSSRISISAPSARGVSGPLAWIAPMP